MSTYRKYIIAGNWKMNKNATEAKDFAEELVEHQGNQTDVSVVVCPPATDLQAVGHVFEGSNCSLGAQNMHPADAGAYTGEVSAEMLRDLFVSYVILGHSERRQYFGETDAFVNEKVHTALRNNLKPILCVGESIEERDAGRMIEVVKHQLLEGVSGVSEDQLDSLVLAYEPIWAIGTGRTASPEQAQEVHAALRGILAEQFSSEAASRVRILYGGSMKPENADSLLAQVDIDGGLIGGASLDVRSFVKLVEAAQAITERQLSATV